MLEILKEAIATGQVILVRYFGGSNPGSEREIAPIQIKGEMVRARCFPGGDVKTFSIQKMEPVIQGQESKLAHLMPKSDIYSCSTLEELYKAKRTDLETLGWAIRLEKDCLKLCSRFKNGKERKTPEIELSYEEMTFDLVFDGQEMKAINHRKKERPWTLRGKKKNTTTFGQLNKAQVAFWEWARELAPNGGSQRATG